MERPRIKVVWVQYEETFGSYGRPGFCGHLIGYIREDGKPSGAFSKNLLPLYIQLFEITNIDFLNEEFRKFLFF